MIERIEGKAQGSENIFGLSPRYEDLSWDGLNFSQDQFNSVIGIDHAAWTAELKLHDELFTTLEYHLPEALKATKAALEAKLSA